MEIKRKYIAIGDLEVYKLARDLSIIAWDVYKSMSWQLKKVIGDQFIRSTDSIGANISEGYNRYHYLDKIKFYYNARASLSEASDHWVSLLLERKIIQEKIYHDFRNISQMLSVKLNNFISSTYKSKSIHK